MGDNGPANLDDYRWLTSEDGARQLRHAAACEEPLLGLVESLRTKLAAPRAHLVADQIELRHRAREKFTRADELLFTRVALEQATSERIARYKASRFPNAETIGDLCCGMGGDLMALAAGRGAVGIDRDPIAALLASANCQRLGLANVSVRCDEVRQLDVSRLSAWHIDPDRRPRQRRTTNPDLHEPNSQAIEQLLLHSQHAAVKLAPAAQVTPQWAARAELEWIGEHRECKQLVVWFGDLAAEPTQRVATLIDETGHPHRIVGRDDAELLRAGKVGRFVFEPHAVVLAASLAGSLASRHGLLAVTADGGYLTSDEPVQDPLLDTFAVDAVLPFDRKRIRAALRQRRIGCLEIKKRGVAVDPGQLRRDLRVSGQNQATLLVGRLRRSTAAILAQRLPNSSR